MLIGRLGMMSMLWFPLMIFCINGATKKLTAEDRKDWMIRDTKAKAFACTILYGTLFPMMGVMAYFQQGRKIRHTEMDDSVLICAGISGILALIAIVVRARGLNAYPRGKALVALGYILPLIFFTVLLIISNVNGGIL